jgi:hypothetical protein
LIIIATWKQVELESVQSAYGINRAYAEYLLKYWEGSKTKEADERTLKVMGKEKASEHIKNWVHRGGYNHNSMNFTNEDKVREILDRYEQKPINAR